MKNYHDFYNRAYQTIFKNREFLKQFFDGFIDPGITKYLDFDNIEFPNKSYVDEDLSKNEDDLIIKVRCNGKEMFVYVLFEFQTTVDSQMPVRLINYEMKFILENWKDLTKVPSILPIVIYIGQSKWNISERFQDLVDNPIAALEKYQVHFEHLLIDINRFDRRKLVQMRNAAARLFYIERLTKEDIEKDRNRIIDVLKDQLGEAGKVIRLYFIEMMKHEGVDGKLIRQVIEKTEKEGDKMLAQAIEGWAEDLKQEGKQEGKLEAAKNMWKKGFKISDIAELTGIPVKELKKSLDIH